MQILRQGLGAMTATWTLSCAHSLPSWSFVPSQSLLQGFSTLSGPWSLPPPPTPCLLSLGLRGPWHGSGCLWLPCARLLGSVSDVCCHPGPLRGLHPSPQPARGSVFSLLRAEASLVFPPHSGIALQEYTKQLLKYLGLAGRPHSGPLVPLADSGLRARPHPLLGRGCWGSGVRERPWTSRLQGSPGRKVMDNRNLEPSGTSTLQTDANPRV